MKTKIVWGAMLGGVGLLSAAYVGSSWYAGKQIDVQLAESIQKLHANYPMLRVSNVKVERGLFSTRQEMIIGLDTDCIRSNINIHGAGPQPLQDLDKFKIRIEQVFKHGPITLAGGIRPSLTTYTGKILLDEKTTQEAKKYFGDHSVLEWHGRIAFNGNYDFAIRSPGVDFKEKADHVVWGGIEGTGTGNINNKSYQFRISAPSLTVDTQATDTRQASKGGLDNLQFSVAGQEGKNKVGLGKVLMTLEHFKMADNSHKQGMEMSKVSYSAEVTESGPFLNVQAGYKIEKMTVDGAEQKQIGPAVIDVAFEHLHAPALIALSQQMNQSMCSDSADPVKAEATSKKLKAFASELLKNDPVFLIKQAKMTYAGNDIEFNGKIGMNGFEPRMLDTPQAAMESLPKAINIAFSGSIPEKMFYTFARAGAANNARRQLALAPSDPLTAEQILTAESTAETNARNQLQMFIAQNYVTQDSDRLRMNFAFHDGQATMNGHPIQLPFLPGSQPRPVTFPTAQNAE